MDRKELMDFFNHRPRNCLLVTSNDEGKVNIAVYGSPTMIDENTVVLSTRENRSFQYLRKNPQAAMIVVEPGEISRTSKGIRIYLEMTAIETMENFWISSRLKWAKEQEKTLRKESKQPYDLRSLRQDLWLIQLAEFASAGVFQQPASFPYFARESAGNRRSPRESLI